MDSALCNSQICISADIEWSFKVSGLCSQNLLPTAMLCIINGKEVEIIIMT